MNNRPFKISQYKAAFSIPFKRIIVRVIRMIGRDIITDFYKGKDEMSMTMLWETGLIGNILNYETYGLARYQ